MRPKLSANNPRIVVEMPSANCPTIISTALSLRPTPRTWRKLLLEVERNILSYLLEEKQ